MCPLTFADERAGSELFVTFAARLAENLSRCCTDADVKPIETSLAEAFVLMRIDRLVFHRLDTRQTTRQTRAIEQRRMRHRTRTSLPCHTCDCFGRCHSK
jgi:hypothetical protein